MRGLGEEPWSGEQELDSVLHLSDDDLALPEADGLLTRSDVDFDHSKYEDTQMPWPLEPKPVTISVASCSHRPSRDHPRKQPFDANTKMTP